MCRIGIAKFCTLEWLNLLYGTNRENPYDACSVFGSRLPKEMEEARQDEMKRFFHYASKSVSHLLSF